MEEILDHLLSMKPYAKWNILNVNWLAGFLPSTVILCQERISIRQLAKREKRTAS